MGAVLCAASVVDILIVGVMAVRGLLMAPVALTLLLELLAVVAAFLVALDSVKVRVFQRLEMPRIPHSG